MAKQNIPYPFVFDELEGLALETKLMFGCLAIYVGNKIVLIQRLRQAPPEDDGIWLATTQEHHESLRKIFPEMRSIKLFGPGETGWQVLPQNALSFERDVVKACALVRAGDSRIGKIPKSRRPKAKKPKMPKLPKTPKVKTGPLKGPRHKRKAPRPPRAKKK